MSRWVSIHQPCYLPWLGLFHKIAHSDIYVVLDDCQLTHRSWINRVNVNAGGRALLLTVPVHFSLEAGTKVFETRIDDHANWRRKHIRTLTQSYGKCPYFKDVAPLIDIVADTDEASLMDMNLRSMRWIMERLEISTPVEFASDRVPSPDLGTGRLIDLVMAVGGNGYLTGLGSAGYLDEDAFRSRGIGLAYQRFHAEPYEQRGAPMFLPNLSIFDVVANIGWPATQAMIERQIPAWKVEVPC